MRQVSIGLDYGTNTVRGLAVDAATGQELAQATFDYPSGESGVISDSADPHLARQYPQDYLDGAEAVLKAIGEQIDLRSVIGLGVDTTGSSPLPVLEGGSALSSDPRFAQNPAALCWLWKDHTSHAEAAEITSAAQGLPYLAKCGGVYSSEWFWSKLLRFIRTAPEAAQAAASWVEICDWIPAQLCGVTDARQIVRGRCAAGHKAMFEEAWGGLPSKEFLAELDPRLADFRNRLFDQVRESDQEAGRVSAEWAAKTGLPEGIPVAVGALDAHFGAVASGASPGVLVKIMGTSTCDVMVHPLDEELPDVPGMCGVVRGSVLPGFYGLEAGQSAVGDIFNWVVRFTGRSHEELTAEAMQLAPGESGLLGLDWHNGNRTILVDPRLTGLLMGLTLHTPPAAVYRAAIEATAFGALRIIERMEEHGVKVARVAACGGIAEKSPLVMQIYADVLNRPVEIAESSQTCALGSAIFGAVVGGAHPDALAAQQAMTQPSSRQFVPNPEAATVYQQLYQLYRELHDSFGFGVHAQGMKRLMEIQEGARG